MTRHVGRHRRRTPSRLLPKAHPARVLSVALLAAALPLALSLPTSAGRPVWAAVGAGVEPVEPAPGTVGPTPVPTVPPMAPLPVQTAPPKPPAWVSPLAADVCRPPYGGGEWHAPRDGGSRLHQGIDLGGREGLGTGFPVRSIGAGTVVAAGYSGGAGNRVNIRVDGAEVRFQHLQRIDVHVGQTVRAGQQIGLMGNTGHSFGSHLHLGLLIGGFYVNPLPWLLERGVDLRCN